MLDYVKGWSGSPLVYLDDPVSLERATSELWSELERSSRAADERQELGYPPGALYLSREELAEGLSGLRVLEGAFMQIPQAVAVSRRHEDASVAWVRSVVDELVATGWVADALSRHGHDPALAAPAVTS